MTDKDQFNTQPTHPKLTGSSENSNSSDFPEKIGPYTIEGLLDKGGMSYLYLAIHPETQDPVAIKVLSKKYISNTEIVQRFLNEAEIISMTNHPNIIKMYGHGEWEGGLYIAMEYVEGTTLRKYLLSHPISLKHALKIIIDISYALCHLHTHGVIHRDLKPENILVTELGNIKVIDFGIAQLLTEKTTPDQPPKQRLIGTPIYISPEQKENPEDVSYPSDIYSLGIISYELILGKLSHGHLHLSLMPSTLQTVLQKCLLPDPNDRYQDVVDFITDISSYLNSPLLQKERMAGDQLSELNEEIQQIQAILTPEPPQFWKEIEIGVASHKKSHIPGIYYDFIQINEEKYGIILAETSCIGAENFVKTAILKGMIHALVLSKKEPQELIFHLNTLLKQNKIGPIFNFNYLTFNIKEKIISYTSLGDKNILLIKEGVITTLPGLNETVALGIEKTIPLQSNTLTWNHNETLFLSILPKEINHSVQKYLQSRFQLPPQQMVDQLLRKLQLSFDNEIKNKPLALVSIRRKR